MTVIKVDIDHWTDGMTIISSPYDETGRVQNVLKSFRFRWNPDDRVWNGTLRYLEPLVAHLRHAGCFIDITEHTPKPWPPPARPSTPDWAGAMFRAIGDHDTAKRAYYALSRVLHPDAAGATDDGPAKTLNSAWNNFDKPTRSSR